MNYLNHSGYAMFYIGQIVGNDTIFTSVNIGQNFFIVLYSM